MNSREFFPMLPARSIQYLFSKCRFSSSTDFPKTELIFSNVIPGQLILSLLRQHKVLAQQGNHSFIFHFYKHSTWSQFIQISSVCAINSYHNQIGVRFGQSTRTKRRTSVAKQATRDQQRGYSWSMVSWAELTCIYCLLAPVTQQHFSNGC